LWGREEYALQITVNNDFNNGRATVLTATTRSTTSAVTPSWPPFHWAKSDRLAVRHACRRRPRLAGHGFRHFSSFGGTDMIMSNANNGGVLVYDIRNNQIIGNNFMGAVGLDWQIAGFGNFSSRGTSDMILRNVNNGALLVYDIDSNQVTGNAS
jgi:hypothetical protein